MREKGYPLHPVRGCRRFGAGVARAAARVGAFHAEKQNAHVYGAIPASGIQSMRVQAPGSLLFAASFRAITYCEFACHSTKWKRPCGCWSNRVDEMAKVLP